MPDEIRDISPHVGKVVFAGVTFYDRAGNEIEMRQYWGTILGLTDDGWIELELHGKNRFGDQSVMVIPPMLETAEPGEYRFRTTAEIVNNPDFLCQWEVHPPEEQTTQTSNQPAQLLDA